ncbi:MAG: hypothetical protein A4E28_00991 [Methanocella sp. PtaU1.Bin125]|nr:MAG: hypothetical protein A4E28_00991 [Methanocella sp. PtaU1.Bin125]
MLASASSSTVSRPSPARATARLIEKVVLPVPPLPAPTAMTVAVFSPGLRVSGNIDGPGSGSGSWAETETGTERGTVAETGTGSGGVLADAPVPDGKISRGRTSFMASSSAISCSGGSFRAAGSLKTAGSSDVYTSSLTSPGFSPDSFQVSNPSDAAATGATPPDRAKQSTPAIASG